MLAHGRRLLILISLFSLAIALTSCKKKSEKHPNNDEFNAIHHYVSLTSFGGKTKISVLRKYPYVEDISCYYIKWNYLENPLKDDLESILVYQAKTFGASMVHLKNITDDPSIEIVWNNISDNQDYTEFSKKDIMFFLETERKIFRPLEKE